MFESQNNPDQVFLNFNANKIRWLADSKIHPVNTFCMSAGEGRKKVSLWKTDSDLFAPQLICEFEDLDGTITELKAKNLQEFFASTSNGSVYQFKLNLNEQIQVLNKWSLPAQKGFEIDNINLINSFDFNSDCDEICFVNEKGTINFIKLHIHDSDESIYTLNHNELCSLNSVLYLKQFEIAVADCLGRVKIWDTRSRENNRAASTLYLEGESSPILCLANHPNQKHMIACGNLNGLVFIYDVRSLKKPFIMSNNNLEPVLEVCFHPFSSDNLLSSSFDGSLWYWSSASKDYSTWEDRSINGKNLLSSNKYSINSFDINNEQILAVNNNNGLYRIKNLNFL